MHDKIYREVRALKIYSFTLTIVLIALLVMSFTREQGNQKFTEIDVERINIIEADGTVKMVISNQKRQHPGMMDGKMLPERQREPGIIFFNTEGDECGGLVFDGNKDGAGFAVSFDQYKNDQVMQLNYGEELNAGKRVRSYGLKLWDRSEAFPLSRQITFFDSLKRLNDTTAFKAGLQKLTEKELIGKQRMFVGKSKEENVGVFINDEKGRPRIKIFVDKKGNPLIEFLDANGKKVPLK
jgi:hypothetical protein